MRFSPGFPPSRCLKIRRILHLKGQCLESGIRDCLALQYTTVSPTPTHPSPVHTRLQSADTVIRIVSNGKNSVALVSTHQYPTVTYRPVLPD